MRILVLGASGFIGVHVVDALRALGVEPLCAQRSPAPRIALRSREATVVRIDLDVPTLAEHLAGFDVVVHAAGHYPAHSLDRAGTLARGLRQTRALLDAVATAGVARLVYVSSTATVARSSDGAPSDESHVFAEPPGFGVYHDLKWEMEAVVARERRFETVIACPSACLGAEDRRIGTCALLLAMARGADPLHPDGLVSLVDVRDVGAAIARLATMPEPPRRVLLSGHDIDLHALLCALALRYGAPPPSAPLPAKAALAWADAAETYAEATGTRAPLPRELVDLVLHGGPLDTRLAVTRLGARWTPLADTLDTFDRWARRQRLLPPPRSPHESQPDL
ncbi:MAG: NAD-dependent epimerase/dehydratase family protein [Pseudomonadota bacterium]|nr:NAD-dependent epimerase/dehydratase family protein [Pseudomonadota bacterium]